MSIDGPFGKVRRWKDGDILYAENDAVLMAHVVTDDLTKLGQLAWHGPNKICVEYVSPKTASLWE